VSRRSLSRAQLKNAGRENERFRSEALGRLAEARAGSRTSRLQAHGHIAIQGMAARAQHVHKKKPQTLNRPPMPMAILTKKRVAAWGVLQRLAGIRPRTRVLSCNRRNLTHPFIRVSNPSIPFQTLQCVLNPSLAQNALRRGFLLRVLIPF
jgi:hypothetical protein